MILVHSNYISIIAQVQAVDCQFVCVVISIYQSVGQSWI